MRVLFGERYGCGKTVVVKVVVIKVVAGLFFAGRIEILWRLGK